MRENYSILVLKWLLGFKSFISVERERESDWAFQGCRLEKRSDREVFGGGGASPSEGEYICS